MLRARVIPVCRVSSRRAWSIQLARSNQGNRTAGRRAWPSTETELHSSQNNWGSPPVENPREPLSEEPAAAGPVAAPLPFLGDVKPSVHCAALSLILPQCHAVGGARSEVFASGKARLFLLVLQVWLFFLPFMLLLVSLSQALKTLFGL